MASGKSAHRASLYPQDISSYNLAIDPFSDTAVLENTSTSYYPLLKTK